MVQFSTLPKIPLEPIERLAPRPWFGGDSFHQNRWPVLWLDGMGGRLEERQVEISFEEPITPWPNLTRLSDPENASDLLTAKLLIYHAMEPKPVGWLKAPSSVPGVHRRFLNLVRYRHVIGAVGNSDLTVSHYRDFETRLLKGGVGALLDIKSRARLLVEAYDSGELKVELDDRGYFFGSHIETLMGLSFNQLSPEAYAVLKEFCDRRQLRFQRTERRLTEDGERINRKTTGDSYRKIWSQLWAYRDILAHDPIGFKAAPLGQGWTGEERRTPDSPPYQTSYLVNAALRLILDDVAVDIIELAQVLGFRNGSEQHHLAVFARIDDRLQKLGFDGLVVFYRHGRWTGGQGNSLRTMVFVIIVVGCLIVLANFTGRRDSELASLRPDCTTMDAYGEPWLECFITKNKNESVKLPATATVQHAVKLLNKIGQAVSGFGKRNWLVEFFDSSGPTGFNMNEALALFAASCKVPVLPDGSTWRFTGNQFRKFFATTHQWRYIYPDLPSLNHQLQQRDMNTTAAYTKMQYAAAMRLNDTRNARKLNDGPLKVALERGRDMRDAELQFMKDLILQVHRGEVKAAGGGASIFREFEEMLARQIDILSSSEDALINDVLGDFVKDRNLRTHREGSNLCKCGSGLAEKSVGVCLSKAVEDGFPIEDAEGPIDAYATRENCFTCANAIRIDLLLPYWDAAYEEASATLASNDPYVRSKAEESLTQINIARTEFR